MADRLKADRHNQVSQASIEAKRGLLRCPACFRSRAAGPPQSGTFTKSGIAISRFDKMAAVIFCDSRGSRPRYISERVVRGSVTVFDVQV